MGSSAYILKSNYLLPNLPVVLVDLKNPGFPCSENLYIYISSTTNISYWICSEPGQSFNKLLNVSFPYLLLQDKSILLLCWKNRPITILASHPFNLSLASLDLLQSPSLSTIYHCISTYLGLLIQSHATSNFVNIPLI